MPTVTGMPTEAEFQAEMDADTLTRAREIEADPSRVERAADHMKRKAELLRETSQSIRRGPGEAERLDMQRGYRKVVIED